MWSSPKEGVSEIGILINKNTKVLVQGITGTQGTFHTGLMLEYGTNIVAGVTPGKGGKKVNGIPVYNTVKVALAKHKASWSVVFVPARFAKDAALEAIAEGLNIVIITENIPLHDNIAIHTAARKKGSIVVGPNTAGLTTVGECKLGIMPNHIFKPGKIGVVSRSGTLTYEIVDELTKSGLGESTVVGIGGDMVIGTDFTDALRLFEKDKKTKAVVLIGEIGGDLEERAAEFIQHHMTKKVVAYIAGRTAPKGKRMGHAGAIISGSSGTAESKTKALESAGIRVAKLPSEIIKLLQD